MEQRTARILGFLLIVGGLLTALTFGGNQGFSAGIFSGLAYIGGFIIAFIGVYFSFIYGRTRDYVE
ncbi:MAG: hypothetical protein ACXAC7_16395 [Candidatus Hodarchaeales archaeon]|jgi:hypothetical protein